MKVYKENIQYFPAPDQSGYTVTYNTAGDTYAGIGYGQTRAAALESARIDWLAKGLAEFDTNTGAQS